MARTLREQSPAMDVYWDDELSMSWCVLTAPHHDGAEAQQNVEAIGRLRDGLGKKKVRVLIDIRAVETITRQARTLYGGPYTFSIQRATALLIDSTISRVVANFVMGINKPASPTRMFTEVDRAIAWLNGFPDE